MKFLPFSGNTFIMEQPKNNAPGQLPSDASTELIQDLKSKFNVDEQEVLNAVIAANNDRAKAEAYLRERTEKK